MEAEGDGIVTREALLKASRPANGAGLGFYEPSPGMLCRAVINRAANSAALWYSPSENLLALAPPKTNFQTKLLHLCSWYRVPRILSEVEGSCGWFWLLAERLSSFVPGSIIYNHH